ncbi:hypothetical protein KSS87_016185, partial [Heliosperma pusillum]
HVILSSKHELHHSHNPHFLDHSYILLLTSCYLLLNKQCCC